MKKRLWIPLALLIFILAGCASPTPAAPVKSVRRPTATAPSPEQIHRNEFPTYSATFHIQFDGDAQWQYQLDLKRSATLREMRLHLEGIEKAKNPGDIRMVTDGATSWMTGPGTDGECIQFPNKEGLDPTFIYPESLIPMENIAAVVKFVREEALAGQNSQYFMGTAAELGSWKNVTVEYHQDKANRALLQFALLGSGDDVFFGSGKGTVTAIYEVTGFDNPTIEPVQGCEIGAPLPDGASHLVRLPGMVSFESASPVEQMRQFYQAQMPPAGWAEKEPPAEAEGKVVLSYQREGEEAQIQVVPADSGGSKVKIVFIKAE